MKKILLFLMIFFLINSVYAFDFKKINPFKKKPPEEKPKMVETREEWLIEATDIPLSERDIQTQEEPKSDKKFYYPEIRYIFDKYNYPPGKRELNIEDVKKNIIEMQEFKIKSDNITNKKVYSLLVILIIQHLYN